MKPAPWLWLRAFPGLLTAPRPEPARQAERIVSIQRRFVLPVKIGVLAVSLYYFFTTDFYTGASTTQVVIFQTLKGYFWVYVACNTVATVLFFNWRRLPSALFQWVVFVLGLLDGLYIAGFLPITGGPDSDLLWIFPILIVLNATSIPLAMPQIVLNLLLTVFYIGASILYANLDQSPNGLQYVPGISPPHSVVAPNSTVAGYPESPEKTHKPISWNPSPAESQEEAFSGRSFVLCVFVMLLLTFCCYGVQALAERQWREIEEAREFAVRESQLHSAGRLAAEFAHQIKNPLAVIANVAYSLERSVRENKNSAAQQIEIIREEVARADQVVTQIMGYAQLSEGRVEKLDVCEELERAIAQVFPPAVPSEIKIARHYASYFPPLLMQRGHLSEIFINLLTNAREAVTGTGRIYLRADCLPDYTVEISIRDDGTGIAPDKMTRIFEAYYTTKSKGSGMGLAIVKHNAELYGGTVQVKSEVGKGTEFILTFPAKAILSIKK